MPLHILRTLCIASICLLSCISSLRAEALYTALLTCSPGTDAYTLFGHTALRVRGETFDWTFNYGMFSFQSEHFIYRFVEGETDYELGLEDYGRFVSRYSRKGFTVYEQELLLSPDEQNRLLGILLTNYEPANRVYRYNFLYDNCTTRALRAIEQAVGHPLDFSASGDTASVTQREILHRFTVSQPWLAMGIDMILGKEIDRPLTADNWRLRLFIPSRLQENLRSTGLVGEETVIAPTGELTGGERFPIAPQGVALLLLFVAIALSWYERKYGTMNWAGCTFDIVMHLLQGSAGIVVAFLFFLSEHPAVGSNLLVICLNPLAYVLVVQDLWLRLKGRPLWAIGRWDVIETINLVVTAGLFVGSFFSPQWIHPALRTVALILFIRSATHLSYPRKPLNPVG